MKEEAEREIVDVLREIRDGQREVLAAIEEHAALVKEQVGISRNNVEESIVLQRLGLRRQRTALLFVLPGIIACIAAIVYLILRYF